MLEQWSRSASGIGTWLHPIRILLRTKLLLELLPLVVGSKELIVRGSVSFVLGWTMLLRLYGLLTLSVWLSYLLLLELWGTMSSISWRWWLLQLMCTFHWRDSMGLLFEFKLQPLLIQTQTIRLHGSICFLIMRWLLLVWLLLSISMRGSVHALAGLSLLALLFC
jgi:hypothetical protein